MSDIGPRCTAQHQFSDDRIGDVRQCTRGTIGADSGHGSTLDPHIDNRNPARWWADPVRAEPLDPRAAERAEHTRQLRALIDRLQLHGGDCIAVLLGQAERLALGIDRYGPLNLDDGHDWQAEEDEERVDIENYRAIRRMVLRRGQQTRSAARKREPETLAELEALLESQAKGR